MKEAAGKERQSALRSCQFAQLDLRRCQYALSLSELQVEKKEKKSQSRDQLSNARPIAHTLRSSRKRLLS